MNYAAPIIDGYNAAVGTNEIRSILENFVEAGYNVPTILIKGLEVADKVVNQEHKEGEDE